MKKFISEVIEEAKKLQIPAKKETYIAILVILVVTIIASLTITLTDITISKIVKLLFGL